MSLLLWLVAALWKASQEKKRAKRKEEALTELHDEINVLKASVSPYPRIACITRNNPEHPEVRATRTSQPCSTLPLTLASRVSIYGNK